MLSLHTHPQPLHTASVSTSTHILSTASAPSISLNVSTVILCCPPIFSLYILHPSTASTSNLSLYTLPQLLRYLHTQPPHLSSEPLHPSSASTFSFILHAHPQPLQPQPSQPQPLHPQPLQPSSASTASFSLTLYINFRAYFRSYIPSYTYL